MIIWTDGNDIEFSEKHMSHPLIKPLEVIKMEMDPSQLPEAWQPKQQTEYHKAIDAFEAADEKYQEMAAKFADGTILYDCMPAASMGEMVERFRSAMDALKDVLDERNSRLQEAQNALRAAIVPKQGAVRGPDGKADFLKYGRFEANTKTSRCFDPDKLFALTQQKGLYGRLFEIQKIDSKNGQLTPVVKQEWKIDYEQVKNFLRENNCEDVIQGAYTEEELTPAVTGPKPIVFMAEQKKTK